MYHQNFATSPSRQARLPSTRIMWDFELPKLPSLTSRNLTTAILPPCMRVVFVMSHLRFRYHKNIIVYLCWNNYILRNPCWKRRVGPLETEIWRTQNFEVEIGPTVSSSSYLIQIIHSSCWSGCLAGCWITCFFLLSPGSIEIWRVWCHPSLLQNNCSQKPGSSVSFVGTAWDAA